MSMPAVRPVPLAVAFATALATLLTGCAVGPNYHTPQLPLPDHYAATAATGSGAIELASWWSALKDPQLDSLIARAIAANPDIEIALITPPV
jgi:outer membrane protein TolC